MIPSFGCCDEETFKITLDYCTQSGLIIRRSSTNAKRRAQHYTQFSHCFSEDDMGMLRLYHLIFTIRKNFTGLCWAQQIWWWSTLASINDNMNIKLLQKFIENVRDPLIFLCPQAFSRPLWLTTVIEFSWRTRLGWDSHWTFLVLHLVGLNKKGCTWVTLLFPEPSIFKYIKHCIYF